MSLPVEFGSLGASRAEPIRLFENERAWTAKVIDYSGYGDPVTPRYDGGRGLVYVRKHLEFLQGVARKIVVFPDFSPTERGKIPTGVAVEFKANINYMQFLGGADIGCRMLMCYLPVTGEEFFSHPETWDLVYQVLKDLKEADLGGGNHFVDGLIRNSDGRMAALVHTGSPAKLQAELSEQINSPLKYRQKYEEVMEGAAKNCNMILGVIEKFYGKLQTVIELVHNSIDFDTNGLAVVRKGAVSLSPEDKLLLSASLKDEVVLCRAGPSVGEASLFSAPHGSGRKVARGMVNTEELIKIYGPPISRGKIDPVGFCQFENISQMVVPEGLGFPPTELPFCYHSIKDTLALLTKYGIVQEVLESWKVVAYLGHL